MVNLTIDGKPIEVPEGTTVLRAAQSANIHIPTLCDHPELTPYGGCRLCLVEIDGFRVLQPSCTMPASNNMVVHTNTDKVRDARKFVLTMLFSERNHFCMYCQVSGGDCELQNSAYGEGMTHWPLQPNWQSYEVDASNPYFVLDNNRCILCRRCVRACGELVGNFTLGFEERGARSALVADLGTPLGESSCISCGTCVQVCPTGALIDRVSAYQGRETQVTHNPTICTGCSIGCGIDVLTRDNRLVRIEGDWNAPVNDGIICKVGRFFPQNEERERIITPLVRKDGKLKATTWDEALDVVSSHMKPLAGKKGNGVSAIASTRLNAESLYLFKSIFAKNFDENATTTLEEGAPTSGAAKLALETGKSFEGTLEALKTADCVVTFGSDLVNNHEVAGFFVKRILPAGVDLVLVDKEANPMADLANAALKASKGSLVDLIHGLDAALAKAKGKSKTADAALQAAVTKTGVKEETFVQAASLIAKAGHPVFIYGKELSFESADAVKALVEFAKAAGAVKDGFMGLINTKGKANSLAASQYQLDKPIVSSGSQAVYLALGDDTLSNRQLQAIGKPAFLAVQASYTSPATAAADVVLPVVIWNEEEGHFLNMEGRLQKSARSITPEETVWTNEAVFKALAAHLGIKVKVDDWKKELTAQVSPVAIIEG